MVGQASPNEKASEKASAKAVADGATPKASARKPPPRRAAAKKPLAVPDDLEAVVLEAVVGVPSLKSSQLKKALPPPYQAFAKEALVAAERLVENGKLHHRKVGKQEIFFARDPALTVDQVVRALVASAPLDLATIKLQVANDASGHESLVEERLTNAVAQGLLFEHPALPRKKKRYGLQRPVPDVSAKLEPLLKLLRKVLAHTDAEGIARQLLANALLTELGLPELPLSAERDQLLAALHELATANPGRALLSVVELRARAALGKERFDTLALALSREGVVSLHHHDHPGSLSESERSELVRDERGTHYIGIALRRA